MAMTKVLIGILLAALIGQACSREATPQPAITPGQKAPVTGQKANWEERWQGILLEARKEGKVSMYSIWPPETRVSLSTAFRDKYGIELEFTPFSRGADLMPKVQSEQRAGLYVADVFGAGNSSLLVTMKPQGLLGSIKPLLVLPEVLDPQVWQTKTVPFTDKEGLSVSLILMWQRTVFYNAGLIREGEISSYKDLLKPQYVGKITSNDPSVPGTGLSAVTHLGHNLWGEQATLDFLKRLLKEQKVAIQRDARLNVEDVARGKYPIGLAPTGAVLANYLELGAPLKVVIVDEDSYLTPAMGAISVPPRFAHPNAAIVFVNWLMTKEGASILARTFGQPANRLDASTEGVNPIFIPIQGKKYYAESEEYLAEMGKWLGLARRIIEETK